MGSLRLHPHAETEKSVPTLRAGVPNISPVVSLSKKKGAVIGLAAAYRSLKKLDRLCDHLLPRDELSELLRMS